MSRSRRLVPVRSTADGAGDHDQAIEHLQRACGVNDPVPLAEMDEETRLLMASTLDLIGATVRQAVVRAGLPDSDPDLPKPA